MKPKRLFKRSLLLGTIALFPFMSACSQTNIDSNFLSKIPEMDEFHKKAKRFSSTIETPFFHFKEKNILNNAFKRLLLTEEGREIFKKSPSDLKLIANSFKEIEGLQGISMGAFENYILADSEFINREDLDQITIALGHELQHHLQPEIPDNLTLDQYLILYKLQEIDSRLTEFQIATEIGITVQMFDQPQYRSYARLYQKNLEIFTKKGHSKKEAKKLAKQKTKAHFFKKYLVSDDSHIDWIWKKDYEIRALESILYSDMKFSKKESQSPKIRKEFDSNLNFYLQECGSFLHKWEIQKTGFDKQDKKLYLLKQSIKLKEALETDPNYRNLPLVEILPLIEKGITVKNLKKNQNRHILDAYLKQNKKSRS